MKYWVKPVLFYIAVFIGMLGLVFVGHQIKKGLFGVRSCQCQVDTPLTQSAFQLLEEFIREHCTDNPEKLIALIKEQFPGIKSVSIHYEAPNQLCAEIDFYKPLALLNDTQLVLENGIVRDKAFFAENLLGTVPVIQCADALIQDQIQDIFLDFLSHSSEKLFKTYQINYLSEHEIVLTQKKPSSNLIIVSDIKTVLDYTLLDRCNELKKELEARSLKERNQKQWIADIRFDRQIVLRADRGSDGKNFC